MLLALSWYQQFLIVNKQILIKMLVFVKEAKDINFKEYVLVIPSVSVGNVGQLAADVIISTLKLTKIGHIRHRNILPVAAHAEGTKGITTECEVFGCPRLKLAVVQIRSTYGRWSTISEFFSTLCKSVKCTVILTGAFAYERKDIHLVMESIRFLQTNVNKLDLPSIPDSWTQVENAINTIPELQIPGSGIADNLFQMCLDQDLPAVLLVNYISEGDNRIDAFNLTSYLDSWLNLRKLAGAGAEWTPPSSWNSLYGNAYPQELF